MEFHSVEDDLENTGQFFRRQSENGLITIGVFKVIFGYRIRAGFTKDLFGCYFDWCAGGDWSNVERLYSIALAILSQREENEDCFLGIPTVSKVKPFFNDTEFMKCIMKLVDSKDYELVNLERTHKG